MPEGVMDKPDKTRLTLNVNGMSKFKVITCNLYPAMYKLLIYLSDSVTDFTNKLTFHILCYSASIN